MPDLEDNAEVQNTGIFGNAFDDEDLNTYNSPFVDQVMGAKADFNNMVPSTVASPIPTTRVHYIHPKDQIIIDPKLAVQTRGMTKKNSRKDVMISYIQKQRRTNHKDFYNCLFACFLSQHEPIKISQALDDESWIDVKSAFLYDIIEEEVYVSQPPGFVDPEFPKKVYKVENALYRLHQAPRAWYETLSTYLLDNGFYRVKYKKDGIFMSQDKYVGEILKKFGFSSIRTASTPMETNKALTKDKDGEDVDVHLYRLISWQCKKQTVVANSTTKAEYIAASHCCGQVLWIQNQMLDYGYNFTQTKIHVDNESAICVVKNPVYHYKTKHIEIQHHFIRDSYEKRLIEMVKIHTDNNVADLLTKAFDVLDLKKKNDAQAVEIPRLKKRVKGLERQRKSSTSQPRRRIYRQVESSDDDLNKEDASKQGRSNDKTKQ
ncbi:retrotransposon protein, putative, unclassified [Tanacetum coccineum]